MPKRLTATALATCAVALGACGGDNGAAKEQSTDLAAARSLPQGPEPADLDPADFTTQIDNPYLPFTPGSRWVYRETTYGEPPEKVVVEVTGKTKRIANGIDAVVVRDTVTLGGEPVEVTDDWYAQDSAGNVWYLGEDTAEYKNGKVDNRGGSFEAGVDGAEAGIAMPADPQVGMAYRQEYYEGEAEDEAAVLSLDEKAQVPLDYYPETLMTRDLVPLEPKVSEHKFYAEGIGLVLALKHSGGEGREELVSFEPGG